MSRAITVLTICETDYYILIRKSEEIVTALNLLLFRSDSTKPEAIDNTKIVPHEGTAVDSSLEKSEDVLRDEDSDVSVFEELVAMAVENICAVIQSHWEKEVMSDLDYLIDGETQDNSLGREVDGPVQSISLRSNKSKAES